MRVGLITDRPYGHYGDGMTRNDTPCTALVTGASSGIGLEIARALGTDGYVVTIASRRPENLERAVAQLRASGCTVEGVVADVGDESAVVDLVEHHRRRHGSLDVLVNNAGIGIGGPIDGYATKHIDLQFAVDLRSIMVMYRSALDLLRSAVESHGSAVVVNVSSITGKRGREWLSVYSAVKAGVVGFTQAMNRELAPTGIRSTVLCPAYVDTQLSQHVTDRLPADEMIRVSDIAESVRFLTRLSHHCLVEEIVFAQPGVEY